MGGFVGDTIDKVTGADKAKKEAEEARKRQEELLKQQELDREREEQFNKEVEQDTSQLAQSQADEVTKPKPSTTVDFSQAIKKEDETEEDKIKKAFRSLRR